MTSPISSNSSVMGGEPVIAGTRIPIQRIAYFARQGNATVDFLQNEYPHLTKSKLNKVINWLVYQGADAQYKAQKAL